MMSIVTDLKLEMREVTIVNIDLVKNLNFKNNLLLK